MRYYYYYYYYYYYLNLLCAWRLSIPRSSSHNSHLLILFYCDIRSTYSPVSLGHWLQVRVAIAAMLRGQCLSRAPSSIAVKFSRSNRVVSVSVSGFPQSPSALKLQPPLQRCLDRRTDIRIHRGLALRSGHGGRRAQQRQSSPQGARDTAKTM